jgi:uncharacterized protein (DUF2147 family)
MTYTQKLLSSATLLCAIFLTSFGAFAQTSIEGQWKTKDDETGRIKSIVEITEVDGKYYGQIIELFRLPDEDPDPLCDECEEDDDRKGKKVLGMQIVRDMELSKGEKAAWSEGTIMDPKKGSIYDCEMWLEDGEPDVLKVRGYIWFIFRTQEWYRVTE